MSESNLHKHFRDDGNVPIPMPPADDSWKLMEQRLNEMLPVTHQTGGQAAPDATGIIAKVLPAIKYLAAAAFVSGAVLYGIHTVNHPAPVSTPEKETAPVSVKDSIITAKDSMKDQGNAITWPDTITATGNNLPVSAAEDAGTSVAANIGTPAENTPVAAKTSAATPTGISTGKAPADAKAAVITAAGISPVNTTTNTKADNVAPTHDAGTVAAKAPSAGKAKVVSVTTGNTPRHAGVAGKPTRILAATNSRSALRSGPGTTAKTNAYHRDPLKSATPQQSGINDTDHPAGSPEDHPIAVVGLADVNHPNATAMLKPGLPVRPTLQSLPLTAGKTSAGHPLTVSRETMDRLAKYHAPPAKSRLTGYWQLMAQWRIPVPVGNNPSHYKGPNGNTQLYRLLIPGIRIQRTWNNAALSLDVNLMTTQLYRNEPYYDKTSPLGSSDLTIRTLLQTYGYSASLAYHHRIAGNFFGSAGVQGYYGHTASILETVKYRDTTGIHTRTTTYGENSKVWDHIGNFQGQITGEIYYDRARWQAAARTVVPVLHTSRDSTGMTMKPVPQVELLLRWKINRRK